ncbi:MAG TPA: glycosyltransferase family 4 protein [Solirubrobacterales bacterium]
MKIAYLCSEYPAISHTFILREVEALRRRGAEIATFSIRRTSPANLLSRADRAAFESTFAILPPSWPRLIRTHLRLALTRPAVYFSVLAGALRLAPAGPRGLLWQLFYFVEAVVLWDECRRRGIRHIHVHFANVSADVALLASRIGSALEPDRPWSWSFTMHGPTEFFDVRHFRLAEKLRQARFVVCISDFARSQLMALSEPDSWQKLPVVHVGIPIEQFTPVGASPPTAAAEILCIGRLVPEKGQAVLIEAIARLVERGLPASATFAGEGPQRGALEALAERLGVGSRVSFRGAVGQEELHALYAAASAFCLPSFSEGVPVVLMEAMAMRLPTIGTTITGVPELIEDGHSGLLVPPGRPDLLTDALQRALSDDALAQTLGEAGRAKVLAEFDADASAEQLHALFAEQIGEMPLRPQSRMNGDAPTRSPVGARPPADPRD